MEPNQELSDFSIAPPQSKSEVLDAPDSIFARAEAYNHTIDTAYIGLGRELYQIFHRRLYLQAGFSTFDDWLELKLGMSRDRGSRVRRIWTKFVKELNLKVDQLEGIGYSRALLLLPVIKSENCDAWLNKAKTLSWRDFNTEIAVAKNPSAEAVDALVAAGATVTKRTPEEDNDDLSGEGGFDDILTGGGGGSLPSERSGLTASGSSPDRRRPPSEDYTDGTQNRPAVEVLAAQRFTVNAKLRDDQFRVWNAAVDEVKRAKKTEVSIGECFAHIATEFLANRMTKEEQPHARVQFYLATFERVFGGKFIWVRNAEAAAVLTRAVEDHPDLFNDAAVPTTTKIEEDGVNHEHPDEHESDEHGE